MHTKFQFGGAYLYETRELCLFRKETTRRRPPAYARNKQIQLKCTFFFLHQQRRKLLFSMVMRFGWKCSTYTIQSIIHSFSTPLLSRRTHVWQGFSFGFEENFVFQRCASVRRGRAATLLLTHMTENQHHIHNRIAQ